MYLCYDTNVLSAYVVPVVLRKQYSLLNRKCSHRKQLPSFRSIRCVAEKPSGEKSTSAKELVEKLKSLDPQKDVKLYQQLKRRIRHISKAIPLQVDNEPVSVIYEDDHILVVNKPSGISISPRHRFLGGTLLNRLIGYLGYTPHVCHRLDMETSGLVLFAKHPTSARKIHQQFCSHQVEKLYLAIVYGIPQQTYFQVCAPIGVDPERKISRKISNNGKEALSQFLLASSCKELNCSLVIAMPLTGRTHQLRIHLHYAGHPIIGDLLYQDTSKYGNQKLCHMNNESRADCWKHLKLHAWKLRFNHPLTGRKQTYEALPEQDFIQLLDILRLPSPRDRILSTQMSLYPSFSKWLDIV
ncbi:hypothetical protein GpartN1_g6000.t1 [Galdieria partita]|uniref:Pseudouridine synthase n=1 Tax=Galdieria partita TaxID=83374 RepID=A0A9C7Q1N7_9RHOD|nr:hypothetical protein GpartN1_g6000.t1 [Galdieria partita]